MTKILESICATLRSMNYIAAINKIRNQIVKIYNLPTYWMKTNTEFNKASCQESGKFKAISLATEFDLIFIYKMDRNKSP